MNLICKIALRKSIRKEIESHVRKQDERREVCEKQIYTVIYRQRDRIYELEQMVMSYLLTTRDRENELIAEIDALKLNL